MNARTAATAAFLAVGLAGGCTGCTGGARTAATIAGVTPVTEAPAGRSPLPAPVSPSHATAPAVGAGTTATSPTPDAATPLPVTASPADVAVSGSALADLATMRAADLGAMFVMDLPGKHLPVHGTDCLTGSRFDAVPSARRSGPLVHAADTHWFVDSTATVFATVHAAKTWMAGRRTEPYVECRRKASQAYQQKSNPRVVLVTRATDDPTVGTDHLEAYTLYALQSLDDKPRHDGGIIGVYDYRFGRTVLEVETALGYEADDPPDLNPRFYQALFSAVDAAGSRVAAAS